MTSGQVTLCKCSLCCHGGPQTGSKAEPQGPQTWWEKKQEGPWVLFIQLRVRGVGGPADRVCHGSNFRFASRAKHVLVKSHICTSAAAANHVCPLLVHSEEGQVFAAREQGRSLVRPLPATAGNFDMPPHSRADREQGLQARRRDV